MFYKNDLRLVYYSNWDESRIKLTSAGCISAECSTNPLCLNYFFWGGGVWSSIKDMWLIYFELSALQTDSWWAYSGLSALYIKLHRTFGSNFIIHFPGSATATERFFPETIPSFLDITAPPSTRTVTSFTSLTIITADVRFGLFVCSCHSGVMC